MNQDRSELSRHHSELWDYQSNRKEKRVSSEEPR